MHALRTALGSGRRSVQLGYAHINGCAWAAREARTFADKLVMDEQDDLDVARRASFQRLTIQPPVHVDLDGVSTMSSTVEWFASEMLSRHGFDDGMFVTRYAKQGGFIVSPARCLFDGLSGLGQGSYDPRDDYPDYVLCLVELLRQQGLQYVVLQDPEEGTHNTDMLQSFVFQDHLYCVDRGAHMFGLLPRDLRSIFATTSVTVEIPTENSDDAGRRL